MEQKIKTYYENNSRKLHKLVDQVLKKLGFREIAHDDFYSLANEVFVKALNNYDNKKDFDGFLYSCLYKKFCTAMTRNCRAKRCCKISVERIDEKGNKIIEQEIIPDIYLDAPVKGIDMTYGDCTAGTNTVESQIFVEGQDDWHIEVREYLNALSPMQRQIALMIAYGYTLQEICDELHITKSHYNNSVKRIFSDDKTKILRPLVRNGK